MANFWDLPRPVRDMIYRLHLVEEEPITTEKHRNFAEDTTEPDMYQVGRRPRICAVSPKAESEAAPIYYGENYFVFGWNKTGSHSSVFSFTGCTSPRHLRMIRKVTFQWPLPYSYHSRAYGMAGESFTEIARFKGLQELYIRVDEEAMVRKMLVSRRSVQLSPPRPLTHQDGIAILRHPGMSGLLKISGVPKVEFIKRFSYSGAEQGGPIPGGYLQTEILSKMVAPRKKTTPCR